MVGSSQADRIDTSGGLIGAVRLTGISKDNFKEITELNNYNNKMDKVNINKIDRIVNSKDIDKQTKIVELASVPLPELKQHISKHPYYIQKAIEHQEQELRDKELCQKL